MPSNASEYGVSSPLEYVPGSPDTSSTPPESDDETISPNLSFKKGRFNSARKSVRIPDLCSSILSTEPVVNANYEKVKLEADNWIKEVFQFDETAAKKNVKADFALMCALSAPYADAEALRMMIDWHNWVFIFDDQFDEGHLKNDPVKAKEELDAHWAILEDRNPPVQLHENSIRYVFQTTWDRVKKRSSEDLQEHWKVSHKMYFDGLLGQVKVAHSQSAFTLTVDEYMNFRRATIGTEPSFALVEYAHGINISQKYLGHPSVRECERVSADLVIFVNDILSYRKDLEQGGEHNLILLLRAQGFSEQEAIDQIGDMILECYRSWYRALAKLPVWGESVDKEVLRYIEACRTIALGNLHFTYTSERYLGHEGAQIRETRIMSLPA
ncbi:Presilphiperfolan-8-beta-ol synthase [Colletotrichum siamense]|uniref:Presilphiperfolan-8-beta-ol synthase n=1 Tax=Colletotrichum siamense TaxID=690259 RepID=UPI0018732555|nr:Presilphiperfolan-8-beta-ol synthase [Colletotrichum siamense]KAF5515885.1 Presilphiperfolan-8-beta-ol synthase [Colletotrichum siamense]